MHTLRLICILGAAFGLVACGGEKLPTDTDAVYTPLASGVARDITPAIDDNQFAQFMASGSEFSVQMYQQLNEQPGNVFFSPFSIQTALAMTYAGAAGQTKTQMAEALQFKLDDTVLHAGFNRLVAAMAARNIPSTADFSGLTLNINNAIWPSNAEAPADTYLDTLALNYGTGVYAVDYINRPDEARIAINDAVTDWTEGLIKDLLPEGSVNPLTRIVLTNTVYLYAPWQKPFREELTQIAAFTNLDGNIVDVDTMSGAMNVRFGETSTAQTVAIPYVNGELEMVIILPSEGTFNQYDIAINSGDLEAISQSLTPSYVSLKMPKFSLEYDQSLIPAFQNLGMVDAFESRADFSGMGLSEDIQITDIFHKTFLDINEKGTEAAAATAVLGGATSVPIIEHTIELNRPFIFMIADRPTGNILFMGRVTTL